MRRTVLLGDKSHNILVYNSFQEENNSKNANSSNSIDHLGFVEIILFHYRNVDNRHSKKSEAGGCALAL